MMRSRKSALFAPVVLLAMLLLCIGTASAGALSASTAANADITVQNNEFKLLFDQDKGGQISAVYDLVNDPATDIATYMAHWGVKVGSAGSAAHYNSYDPAARLALGESIGARAKVTQGGGFYLSGKYIDLNSDSTFTVYPNGKIYMMHAFTNVNATSGTNYASAISFLSAAAGAAYGRYTDNGDATPDEDDWWHQIVRNDLQAPKKNTSISLGYYNAGMYNTAWNPSNWYSQANTSYWLADLNPDPAAGQAYNIASLFIISDEGTTGAGGQEAWLDAAYLDYRTPDTLFTYAGTSQGFDYGAGAYVVTAGGNKADFMISTTAGGAAISRYKPAFEIRNYTAATKPLLRYNGIEQVEGVDYIAGVNTEGSYAVVVWMHDIISPATGHFEIAESFAGGMCNSGETQQCGTTDVGECSYGTSTCADGSWGACIGAVGPAAETCDSLDNDCDGTIDDGVCVCTGGIAWGACSPTKPQFCSNGSLIDNCVQCNCPADKPFCDQQSGSCLKKCTDNTVDGQCSNVNKGKKCVNGILVDACTASGECSCAAGFACNAEGKCGYDASNISEHPRIWITNIIGGLREKVQANTKEWDDVNKYCVKFPPMGNLSPLDKEKHVMVQEALAYAVMKGVRPAEAPQYADAALQAMDMVKGYDIAWLRTYEYIFSMALALDWLQDGTCSSDADCQSFEYCSNSKACTYDGLTEAKKQEYVTNIDNRIYAMKYGEWDYLYNGLFGGYALSYMEAEGVAGYVLYGDDVNARVFIDHATEKQKGIWAAFRISDLGNGGAYDGKMYAAGRWESVISYAEAVKSATGDDLYEQFFFDRLRFITYELHPDNNYTHAYSSGDIKASQRAPLHNVFYPQLTPLANRYYDEFGKYTYWLMRNVYDVTGTTHDKLNSAYGSTLKAFLWYDREKLGENPSGEIPLAYWGGGPNGAGAITMRSDWGQSPTWASFTCGNWIGGGHQDIMQLDFQIYANGGDLAIQSGSYTGYGDRLSDRRYSGRTVASNSLLICEPNEHWDNSLRGDGGGKFVYNNDCGQRSWGDMPQVSHTAEEWMMWNSDGDNLRVCTVKAFEETNGNFIYAYGNGLSAYNNPQYMSDPDFWPQNIAKVDKVMREFVYLPKPGLAGNEFFVIFDRVNSTNKDFPKKWLMHSINRPTFTAAMAQQQGDATKGIWSTTSWNNAMDTVTFIEGTGRLTQKILLPQNPKITLIGGGGADEATGYVQWVEDYPTGTGKNETRYTDGIFGEWRYEVSPQTAQKFDNFLNVLYPSEKSVTTIPETLLIEAGAMKGTLINDAVPRVVLFSAEGEVQSSAAYAVQYSGTGRHLLLDMAPGTYDIYVGGGKVLSAAASSQGALYFEVNGGGSFQLTQTGESPGVPQCGNGAIPSTGCKCGGIDKSTGYCCSNAWQATACQQSCEQQGKIECNGICVTPVCTLDSQCQQWKECKNAGTCNSRCGVSMPGLMNYVVQWRHGTLSLADIFAKLAEWNQG